MAVWLPINNDCDATGFDGCVSPTTEGTYDLYLRMAEPHRFTILDFGESSTGLLFGSSQVFQNGANTPLKPRPPNLPPRCPCLEFDSFFDFGGGSFSFFVEPSPDQWLTPLSAVWFADLGTVVQAAQKPTLFSDGAYYFRVLRLTIDPTAIVSGNLLALGTEFGTGKSLAVDVEIPALP